jgi:hypothetical protein
MSHGAQPDLLFSPPGPSISRREHRVLLLLAGAWLVNLFDLGFTLLARQQGLMTELNPLADHFLNRGARAVILYKLVLLTAGSAVLWWQRRRLLSEAALWGYAVLCMGLALHWHTLYHTAEPLWIEAATAQASLPPDTG